MPDFGVACGRPVTRRDGHDPAATALALYVVYGLVGFGWRSLVQWRRTGDAGFRLSPAAPVQARVASGLMIGGGALGAAAAGRAARRRRGERPWRGP
jgi:hypothetical protein